MKALPLSERIQTFWSKVDCSGPCWEWQGFRPNGTGYGRISYNGKQTRTHRFAWLITHGPIPDGLIVCHRCDNPPCVRPSHLYLGTVQDNSNDAIERGRTARGDRNGSRLYPERLKRGAEHPSHTHPEAWRRGEAHHSAKLTTEEVRELRARYAAGERNQTHLGADYGISQATVWNIINRNTWRHVA